MIPGLGPIDLGGFSGSSSASANSGPVSSGSVNFGNTKGKTRLASFETTDNTVLYLTLAVVAVVIFVAAKKKG